MMTNRSRIVTAVGGANRGGHRDRSDIGSIGTFENKPPSPYRTGPEWIPLPFNRRCSDHEPSTVPSTGGRPPADTKRFPQLRSTRRAATHHNGATLSTSIAVTTRFPAAGSMMWISGWRISSRSNSNTAGESGSRIAVPDSCGLAAVRGGLHDRQVRPHPATGLDDVQAILNQSRIPWAEQRLDCARIAVIRLSWKSGQISGRSIYGSIPGKGKGSEISPPDRCKAARGSHVEA